MNKESDDFIRDVARWTVTSRTEINPACCGEKGCGMAEKCKSETPQRDAAVAAQTGKDNDAYYGMWVLVGKLERALAESRAECERLNKELQAASIDYRGCMLDRAEYLRRMREAEAECERLGRLVYSLSWQRKDFRERWLHNLERATRLHSERAVMENRVFSAEAREREAYERAAKVASEKISEYSGNDACAVYVANILRSLAGERREG